MRISDWSSDVCSSDLHVLVEVGRNAQECDLDPSEATTQVAKPCPCGLHLLQDLVGRIDIEEQPQVDLPAQRSEEHTSELQSLMRISYAVFCLKKKKKRKHIQNNQHAHKLTHTYEA